MAEVFLRLASNKPNRPFVDTYIDSSEVNQGSRSAGSTLARLSGLNRCSRELEGESVVWIVVEARLRHIL